MTLVRYNPNRHLGTVPAFGSLFDGFFDDNFTKEVSKKGFSPTVDIAESEKQYDIYMALPGLSKKDINIETVDGQLKISGERKFEKEDEGKNFHRLETSYGTFERTFNLPENVLLEKVEATFSDGILNVTLPKDEEKAKIHSIKIK